MKRFRVKHDPHLDVFLYLDDVERIVRVLNEHDFECSPAQARELWQIYSSSMSAGWMVLPAEDRLIYMFVEPFMLVAGERCDRCENSGSVGSGMDTRFCTCSAGQRLKIAMEYDDG